MCSLDTNYETDAENCGECGNACVYPNGVSACVQGSCLLAGCDPGYVNLDGDPSTGCEYLCTYIQESDPPDPEGIDADCDGVDGDLERAIFVAATGYDLGNSIGNRTNPFKTIGRALTFADENGDLGRDLVLVGEGTFKEYVELVSGISIYGGYNESWMRDLDEYPTRITWDKADIRGNIVVVHGKDIGMPTELQGLVIEASSNPVASGSVYGIHALNCGDFLTLRALEVSVGDGASGPVGSIGTNGADGDPGGAGTDGTSENYNPDDDAKGGVGGVGLCYGMNSSGGIGGNGGYEGGWWSDTDATSGTDSPTGNVGGSPGGTEKPGNAGEAGGSGASGADGAGCSVELMDQQAGFWAPPSRPSGGDGTSGEGGGGGGGGGPKDISWGLFGGGAFGGGGGGGASGGCGGYGGTPGQNGGGSFAIFLMDSSPELEALSIFHGDGGNGGMGGAGGSGGLAKPGGNGGKGTDDSGDGGKGGDSGAGGRGGHGGGGCGGPSFGLTIVGTSDPKCVDVKVMSGGTGGLGGLVGNPATGQVVQDGYPGGNGPSGNANKQTPSCQL